MVWTQQSLQNLNCPPLCARPLNGKQLQGRRSLANWLEIVPAKSMLGNWEEYCAAGEQVVVVA